MKYRFHWRANGADHETTIEAPAYPVACYKLALSHVMTWCVEKDQMPPADFACDLSKPEIVE